MKRIFTIIAASSTLLLASCGTTGVFNAATVSAIEAEVQADANLVCGFIPTVGTIAAFIPGVSSVVPAAASIAESICAAIAAAPQPKVLSARRRSIVNQMAVNVAVVRVPNVGPVAISGTFTR
jgi:hypothetical protein